MKRLRAGPRTRSHARTEFSRHGHNRDLDVRSLTETGCACGRMPMSAFSLTTLNEGQKVEYELVPRENGKSSAEKLVVLD